MEQINNCLDKHYYPSTIHQSLHYSPENAYPLTLCNDLAESTQITIQQMIDHQGKGIISLDIHPNGERLITLGDD